MSVTQIPDWALHPAPIDSLRALRSSPFSQSKQSVALWVPEYDRGQPARIPQNFEAAVKDGWRRNELIFACIMKTMKARASVRMVVRNKRTGDEIENHGFRQFLAASNPLTEFAFHASVVMFQKLSGHAYYEVIRSRAGLPVQLWPLRPDWIRPVLNHTGLIGWEYKRAGSSTDIAPLRAQDVIDIPIPDPLHMFGGTAPVSVAGYSGDVDNAISVFAKDFFERGALPYGVLSTEQYMDGDEISESQARWESRYGGGPGRALRAPAILTKGQSYQKISMSFEEMGFEALDSRNEARICMVMDIPPILVGATVGLERATYSNYEQARESWWQDSILPDLTHEADALTPLAMEFGGGDIELGWDTSDVVALQEDEQKIHEQVRADLTSGYITIDEARERVNLDALPNGAGQVFLRPISVLEVPMGEAGRTVAPIDPNAQPPADNTSEDAQNPPGDAQVPPKAFGPNGHHKAAPAHDDAVRRKHERRMQQAMTEFFAGELQRIEHELQRLPVGSGT